MTRTAARSLCGTGSRAWRRPRRPTPTSAPTSRRPPPPRRKSSARRRSVGARRGPPFSANPSQGRRKQAARAFADGGGRVGGGAGAAAQHTGLLCRDRRPEPRPHPAAAAPPSKRRRLHRKDRMAGGRPWRGSFVWGLGGGGHCSGGPRGPAYVPSTRNAPPPGKSRLVTPAWQKPMRKSSGAKETESRLRRNGMEGSTCGLSSVLNHRSLSRYANATQCNTSWWLSSEIPCFSASGNFGV